MPSVARLGDTGMGICPGHPIPVPFTSVIVSGSPNVLANGSFVANMSSVSVCSCGHSAVVTMGSPTVLANAQSVHRLGDTGLTGGGGTYVQVQGAPTVLSN